MCGQLETDYVLSLVLCLLSALAINAQDKTAKTPPKIIGYTITLVDGYSFDVDEVSKQGEETWVRKGNIQRQVQGPIKSIKPIVEQTKAEAAEAPKTVTTSSYDHHHHQTRRSQADLDLSGRRRQIPCRSSSGTG